MTSSIGNAIGSLLGMKSVPSLVDLTDPHGLPNAPTNTGGGIAAQVAHAAAHSYPSYQPQASAIPLSGVSGVPFGEYVEPLVYATRVHMMQPSDKRWRRFQHALFLLDDVICVYSETNNRDRIIVRLSSVHRATRVIDELNFAFTLPFDCDDPVQWFAEHVLNMDFPNNKPST